MAKVQLDYSPDTKKAAPAAPAAAPVYQDAFARKAGITLTNDMSSGVKPTVVPVPDGNVVDKNPPVDPMVQLQLDAQNAARVDAFKLLQDTFTAYGLIDPKLGQNDPFLQTITNLMKGYTDPATGKITQVGPNEATILLKQTDAYKKRFAGNEARAAAGLNVLSEGDYVALEDKFSNLFQQYGLNQFSNRTEFASLIGKDISNVELNSRLDLAVNQVANADPMVKQTLKQFYPNITDADLTAYFLKPEETLPMLQQKVTSAQIGTAALSQGLTTDVTRATELAKLGVTEAGAKAGYQKVATVLPETAKLSSIYGEAGIKYDQAAAEKEFLLGKADVTRQRQQLAQLESASFSGKAGINQNINPLTKSVQGKF